MNSLEGGRGHPDQAAVSRAGTASGACPTTSTTSRRWPACPRSSNAGPSGSPRSAPTSEHRHQAVALSGHVKQPGRLRSADGPAAEGAVQRPRRRMCTTTGRSRPASPAARRCRAARRGLRGQPGLRFAGQGRHHARLGRHDDHGQFDLHGRSAAPHRALLRRRILRPVHALPRGHGLDGADPRAHRERRGTRRETSTCWSTSPTTSRATRSARWATRRPGRCSRSSRSSATSSRLTSTREGERTDECLRC